MTSTTYYAPASSATRTTRRPSGERRKTLRLDTGSVLRIVDGRGLRVKVTSGIAWITEEGNLDDFVLLPGDSHRIANAGLTLVLAHRAARVTMAVPAGIFLPRRMDIARADGQPGRRIAFGGGVALRLRATVSAAINIVRSVIDAFADVAPAPMPARPGDRDALSRDVPFPHH